MNKTKLQLYLLCLLMVFILYFGFIYKKEPNWQGMPVKDKEEVFTRLKEWLNR